MGENMRGIGAMARASGLSVSALRFYDAEGILAPSWVDPDSGYRWYDDGQVVSARLIASLRRVRMPLTEIVRLLEAQQTRPVVAKIIDDHLSRLEAGLADARRELSRVLSILDDQEKPMTGITTLTVSGAALKSAFAAVRYAASADPALPELGGVFLDITDSGVSAVATDRFRLAVAPLEASVSGAPQGRLLSSALVDEVAGQLPAGAEVTISLSPDSSTLSWTGGELREAVADGEFPNYRRLLSLNEPSQRITLHGPTFRRSLEAAPVRALGGSSRVAVLSVDAAGQFCFDGSRAEAVDVGVNPEFLLEALDGYDAERGSQLVLGLDGPIAPLVLSDPARPGHVHLLMPVKVDAGA